jgi:hypothetical protein
MAKPAFSLPSRLRSVFLAAPVFALGLTVTTWGTNCVPTGTAPAWDGGAAKPSKVITERSDVLREVFEDDFERDLDALAPLPVLAPATPIEPISSWQGDFLALSDASRLDASRLDGSAASTKVDLLKLGVKTSGLKDGGVDAQADVTEAPKASPAPALPQSLLGPNWYQSKTSAWQIEKGRLCGQGARNHGVWLQRPIPINARIEFDAIATNPKGDLKAEIWGDGQSSATTVSYSNATSYLAILGGWENSIHALARINEHGKDRKELQVDRESDDARRQPVAVGQVYRFKIERTDGKTVVWSVGGTEYLRYEDAEPLAGMGHDHFGFNNWEVKVCFDNLKITPL